MNHLAQKDFDLLRRLLEAAPVGASLTQLANRLDMTPSLLSRRLKALTEEGWVARESISTAEGREVHYRVLRGIGIHWVDGDVGLARSWTAREIDWEFPLVSRLHDAHARASAISYLRALRSAGILDAPRKTSAVKDRGPMLEHLGVAIVAIGSVVVGRVDRGSDVDLVVVFSDEQGVNLTEQAEEIAAEISLSTPRAVQARTRSVDEIAQADDIISQAVRENGLLVYDSLRRPSGGKDERVVKLVEGMRA